MAEKITGKARHYIPLRTQELITIATDGLALARMVVEGDRLGTIRTPEIIRAARELIKKAGVE